MKNMRYFYNYCKISHMKKNYFKPLLLGISLFSISVFGQQEKPKYDYQEAFKPFFYQNNATETRSASGKPGHNYWQNRADYNLNVSLNEEKNEIYLGKKTIMDGTKVIAHDWRSPICSMYYDYNIGDAEYISNTGEKRKGKIIKKRQIIIKDGVLKAVDDEVILMEFNSPTSPCMIKQPEGNMYEYLVLPVRING